MKYAVPILHAAMINWFLKQAENHNYEPETEHLESLILQRFL
jgi:hypothetical protein